MNIELTSIPSPEAAGFQECGFDSNGHVPHQNRPQEVSGLDSSNVLSNGAGSSSQLIPHQSQPCPSVQNDVPNTTPHIQPTPVREWTSIWLRQNTLISLIVLTLALMIPMAVLSTLSSQRHGIASVNLNTNLVEVPTFQLDITTTWTLIPTLIVQIYVLLISAVISAAGARQPFIELRQQGSRPDGAAAEKSVFLDYQADLAPVAAARAFKYNHYMLAWSFVISMLMNIVLTALGSHLFFTAPFPAPGSIAVSKTSEFNDGGFGNSEAADLTPTISIVAATRIYDGRQIAWTTLNESIPPFSVPHLASPTRLEVHAKAYSASLDCRVLQSPYEFELRNTIDGWEFDIADRGCELNNQFFANSQLHKYGADYINTYATVICGLSAGTSRVVVVAATNPNAGNGTSGSQLTNKTAVSCIPAYYAVFGTLDISIDPTKPHDPVINNFDATNIVARSPRPVFADNFETQLSQPGVLDDEAIVYANDFGYIIYSYAKKLAPHAYFNGDVLEHVTQDLFTTAFAVMANRFLVQTAAVPTETRGTYFTEETRLVVVGPVAYVFICILFFICVILAWILVYTKNHKSIQYEDMKGMVGAAAVLRHSELIRDVESIDAQGCAGKIAEEFQSQTAARIYPKGWTYESWERPNDARLVSKRTVQRFGLFVRK